MRIENFYRAENKTAWISVAYDTKAAGAEEIEIIDWST